MNYIADFMCKELMLVIEVDGYSHWSDEAKRKMNKEKKFYNGQASLFHDSLMKKY